MRDIQVRNVDVDANVERGRILQIQFSAVSRVLCGENTFAVFLGTKGILCAVAVAVAAATTRTTSNHVSQTLFVL